MFKDLRNKICQFFAITLGTLWVAVAIADNLMPAAELTIFLEDMHAFAADFNQVSFDSAGNSFQEVQGKMLVQRPGKLYWHTAKPFEQLVISDGSQLWVYDPDLEQVIVQDFDARLTQTPALLLSGEIESLQNAFEIEVQLSEAEYSDRIFKLTPRQPDSLFEQLTLHFRNRSLVEMGLKDSLGQRSRIIFRNMQENPKINADQFIFIPPSGVDVIKGQ